VLSSFDWRDKIESSHGLPKIDLLMKRRSDFHATATKEPIRLQPASFRASLAWVVE
jgi:hypothetical protein